MKCQKLRPRREGLMSLHYLWCRECREMQEIDAMIARGMDAFRRPPLPAVRREFPVQYRNVVLIAATVSLVIFVFWSILAPSSKPKGYATVPPPSIKNQEPKHGLTPKTSPLTADHQSTTSQDPQRTPPKPAIVHVTDEGFLNQDRGELANFWRVAPAQELNLTAILHRPLPTMKDDFVALPDIQVADEGTPEQQRQAAEQIYAEYEQQASISDDRLTKMVAFASPQDSLQEVCESLRKQTGVAIDAARNVADDNICLFIKRRPARDVMRAITKLFGYVWVRTGKDGALHYSLEQDTKGQIAEENIRKDDIASAFTRIVDANRRNTNSVGLEKAVRKLFEQLTVSELQTLRGGGEVALTNNPRSARPIDPDLAFALMDNFGRVREVGPGDYILTGDGVRPSEIPGTQLTVTYSIVVGEFGGATAKGNVNITMANPNGGNGTSWNHPVSLAEVEGSGEGSPNNATVGADQAKLMPLLAQITVKPSESVAQPRVSSRGAGVYEMGTMTGWNSIAKGIPAGSYTSPGELWNAIQSATGFDIVADSFSRLVTTRARSGNAFSVLNEYGDLGRFRWRYDDGIVYSRSTTFAWERLNEVPKRLVLRWKKLSEGGKHLPAKEIVSMAQLSDRQLDAWSIGQRLYHREGIQDWAVIARPWLLGYPANLRMLRQIGRSLANVPSSSLDRMTQGPVGLNSLATEIRGDLVAKFGPWKSEPVYVALDYVPANQLFWHSKAVEEQPRTLGLYAGSNEDLAKLVKAHDLNADGGNAVQSGGHWSLLFYGADGTLIRRVGDDGQIIIVY